MKIIQKCINQIIITHEYILHTWRSLIWRLMAVMCAYAVAASALPMALSLCKAPSFTLISVTFSRMNTFDTTMLRYPPWSYLVCICSCGEHQITKGDRQRSWTTQKNRKWMYENRDDRVNLQRWRGWVGRQWRMRELSFPSILFKLGSAYLYKIYARECVTCLQKCYLNFSKYYRGKKMCVVHLSRSLLKH